MTKIVAPFRNDSNQRYSKQLFWEQWIQLPIVDRVIEPPFTLFANKEGYVNLGKEYINDADPTGYTTSTRIFQDFSYWKHLLKAAWFREAVRLWNEELSAKLYAQGLARIKKIAADEENKGSLAAAKYLVDKFGDKQSIKRGRPSSDEVEGKVNELAREERELRDAAARITVVK